MNPKIYLIGIVHSAQSENLLNVRLSLLDKKGFSSDFIDEEKNKILDLKKYLLNLLSDLKPDLVIEECGPWVDSPGDTLLKIINEETFLQKEFKNNHYFYDARILNGVKPSADIREKEIAIFSLDLIREKSTNINCIIVGASHLQAIESLLKDSGIDVVTLNLKEKFKLGTP